jgi:hypothetical protein
MPLLDVDKPGPVDWLNSHIAFQMSDRERLARERGDPDDVLMNVKESIHSIITIFAGLQPAERTATFGLADPDTVGNHTLIFVHGLRLDEAAFTVIADVAVLPLHQDLMPKISNQLRAFVGGLRSVVTRGKEASAWRQILPAFVERARTWTHKENCEYTATGRIPPSEELDGIALCSCGQGVDLPPEMWKVSKWKGLLPFATRAVISPLFAVSYVEQVGGAAAKIFGGAKKKATAAPGEACQACGGQGKPKLLVCGKCKSAWYCSTECQVRDWRAGHKGQCKKS